MSRVSHRIGVVLAVPCLLASALALVTLLSQKDVSAPDSMSAIGGFALLAGVLYVLARTVGWIVNGAAAE